MKRYICMLTVVILFLGMCSTKVYADDPTDKTTFLASPMFFDNELDKLKFKQADAIAENQKAYVRIKDVIAAESKNSEAIRVSAFKIQLMYFSKGFGKGKNYNYEIAAMYNNNLYLFGINEKSEQVDFIDSFEKASINDVKIDVSYTGNYIKLWSQAPYNAFERTEILKWNGKNLAKVMLKEEDPTQKFLDIQKKFIAAGRFKEATKLIAKEGGVLYPASYSDYKSMGKEALSQAEKQVKKVSVAPYGINIWAEAIDYYFNFYDCKEYKITINDISSFSKQQLGEISKLIPEESSLKTSDWTKLINLYGDLLYKNGNVKKSLNYYLKSIELNENDKDAYLAAGDAYYSLKKSDEAKKMYKKFVDLSLNDSKNIPPRVIQRLK